MVLKPLGILTDGLGALRSFKIFIFYNALPSTFQPERIAIHFDKSVDEINHSLVLLHPGDAVTVEILQIACTVILHQEIDEMFLFLIFCIFLSTEQPGNNLLDSCAIEAVFCPFQLHQFTITLGQFRVQSIRRCLFVALFLHPGIETFYFCLRNILIEIAGRSLYQILAIRLIHALRHNFRIEDDRHQNAQQVFLALTLGKRQIFIGNRPNHLIERFL